MGDGTFDDADHPEGAPWVARRVPLRRADWHERLMARTALIVDPDRAHAHRLAALLGAEGFEVTVVDNGDDAAEHLASTPPALLVLELSLPRRDGFDLLSTLRNTDVQARHGAKAVATTAVVVVSAFAALRAEAFERKHTLGIVAILPRRAGRDAILRAIRRAVPTPQRRRSLTRAVDGPAHHLLDDQAPRPSPALLHPLRERLLKALPSVEIVDGDTDDLRTLLATIRTTLQVPMVTVSIVSGENQWMPIADGVLANFPAPTAGIAIEDGIESVFCRHLIDADAPQVLIVPDAATHPVFQRQPLVAAGVVRAYVGVPLVLSSGVVAGALCVLSDSPLTLNAADVDALSTWSRQLTGRLELRLAAHEPPSLFENFDHRLTAILDHLEVGVVLLSGDERKVLFANRAVGVLLDCDVGDLVGQPRRAFVDAAARAADNADAVRAQLAIPADGAYVGCSDLELIRPQRRVVRWSAKPILVDGVVHQLAMLTDVTADVDLATANAQAAFLDPLTGLLNRRGFLEQLKREQARAGRTEEPISVALFDIDHFKKVNDTFGHQVGDEVLVAVASVLHEGLRGADVAARWGGEEFLLALPGQGLEDARAVCERIRVAVADLETRAGKVTISAGVARIEQSFEAAVSLADQRLYDAKNNGRNQIR